MMRMRLKILVPLLILCGTAFSQICTPVNPTQYCQHFLRIIPDSVCGLPSKDTTLRTGDSATAQIFYNTLDNNIWAYSRQRGFFKVGLLSGLQGVTDNGNATTDSINVINDAGNRLVTLYRNAQFGDYWSGQGTFADNLNGDSLTITPRGVIKNNNVTHFTTTYNWGNSSTSNHVIDELTDISGTHALIAGDSINLPQNILWQDVLGLFHKAAVPSGGGNTIYTGDDSLRGNRIVSGQGIYSLKLDSISDFTLNAGNSATISTISSDMNLNTGNMLNINTSSVSQALGISPDGSFLFNTAQVGGVLNINVDGSGNLEAHNPSGGIWNIDNWNNDGSHTWSVNNGSSSYNALSVNNYSNSIAVHAESASGSTQDVLVAGRTGFGDFFWVHDNGNVEANSYKQPLFTNAMVWANGSGVLIAADSSATGNYVTPTSASTLYLKKSNNLFDLTSTETAKSNMNLKQTTPAGTTSVAFFTNELIESITIIEPTSISVSIGTTMGGNDIISSWGVSGRANLEIGYSNATGGTLYFTGLTSNSIIKIYKR